MPPTFTTLCAVLLFGARAVAQYSNATITSSVGESYPAPATSEITPSSPTTTSEAWSSYASSSLPASGLSSSSGLPDINTELFSPKVPHTEISRTSLDVPSSATAVAPEAVTPVAPVIGTTTSAGISSTTALLVAEVAPVGAANSTVPLPLPLGPGTGVSLSTIVQTTTTPLNIPAYAPSTPVASNVTSSTPEPGSSDAPETSWEASTSASSVLFSYAPAFTSTQNTVATSSPSRAIYSYAPVSTASSEPHFAAAAPPKNVSTSSTAPAFTYDHQAPMTSSSKSSIPTSESLGLLTVSINPSGEFILGSITLHAGSTMTRGHGASVTEIGLEEASGSTALVVKAPHTTASAFLPKFMKPTSGSGLVSSMSRVLEYDSASSALAKGKHEATGTAIAASDTQSTTSYPPGTLNNGASGALIASGCACALSAMLLSAFVLL